MSTSITPQPVVAPAGHVTPGWKTSEFWLSLFTILGGTAQAVAKPNTGVGIAGAAISAGAAAAYTLSRAYTKGQASQAAGQAAGQASAP